MGDGSGGAGARMIGATTVHHCNLEVNYVAHKSDAILTYEFYINHRGRAILALGCICSLINSKFKINSKQNLKILIFL